MQGVASSQMWLLIDFLFLSVEYETNSLSFLTYFLSSRPLFIPPFYFHNLLPVLYLGIPFWKLPLPPPILKRDTKDACDSLPPCPLTVCIHYLAQFLSCDLILTLNMILLLMHIYTLYWYGSVLHALSYTLNWDQNYFCWTGSHQYTTKYYICLFCDLITSLGWKLINGTLFWGRYSRPYSIWFPRK